MFPKSNAFDTASKFDPEIAERPTTEAIPTSYNYWRWAKWGGVVSWW